MTKLTKRQKRTLNKQGMNLKSEKIQPNSLSIKIIKPLTDNQQQVFDSYDSEQNLMIHGYPGTGKTYLAMFLSLEEILSEDSPYKKLIIVRSAVATRDIGHLPGDVEEKIAVYESPYEGNAAKLFGRGDAYGILKTKGLVEFVPTSHVRGITFENCIVLVDEIQNLTFHEASSIITRAGDNCKFILSGDYRQSDLQKREKEDVKKICSVCSIMESFDFIEMTKDDIVRSDIVKEFIIAVEKAGFEF